MAYATSKRYASLPSLSPDGAFGTSERLYLDSRTLRHQLKAAAPPLQPPAASPQTFRTVPIFIFSSDMELPLFIDRIHQVRSRWHTLVSTSVDGTSVDSTSAE